MLKLPSRSSSLNPLSTTFRPSLTFSQGTRKATMSYFAPPAKPKTELGYHRILAPSAGVKVSPLCLGAMSFGEGWKDFMGECSKTTSFEILDSFFDFGGNFVRTPASRFHTLT